MDGKDYYQVLGVDRGVGTSEIRRRYLAMAKQHHPDHEGDTRVMMRLNEAYETLSNPQSRFLYNNQLDDQEIAAAASDFEMTEPQTRPRYHEEARPVYRAAQAAPQPQKTRHTAHTARRARPQKRSFAGRVFSFAATAAMIVIAGAVIAGHIPTQGVTSALDLTQPSDPVGVTSSNATGTEPAPPSSTSAASGSTAANTADGATGTDPTQPTGTTADGTLQPTTPAETHYRCSLHYIASYKRMNCN